VSLRTRSRKSKERRGIERDFPGLFRRRWCRAVKRKFSNCRHTSSGSGPSGTKFNFPTMTSARPSISRGQPQRARARARHPFCGSLLTRARARAHAHVSPVRRYKTPGILYAVISCRMCAGPIESRPVPRRPRSGSPSLVGISIPRSRWRTPARVHVLLSSPVSSSASSCSRVRQAREPRLKFRLLDPR